MILVALYALYLAIAIAIFLATLKPDVSPLDAREPFVSVVVAARNEGTTIRACLESLKSQGIPPNRYEVIVVDDHSTDATPAAIEDARAGSNLIRRLRLSEGRSGKKQALIMGIAAARGDRILMTDADCVVNPHWVSELSSFLGPRRAMVGGATLLHPTGRLFDRLQAIEYAYMLSVGIAASRAFRTVSLFGNNMGFEKKAYAASGGFEGIDSEVLIDYRLVRAFAEGKAGPAQHIFNGNSVVWTEPMKTLRDYVGQRKRWSQGVLKTMSGWKLLLIPLFAAYLAATVLPFFTGFLPLILALRLLADLLVVLNPVVRFRQTGLLPALLLFEVNLSLMVLYLGGPLLLPSKTRWKGRTVG